MFTRRIEHICKPLNENDCLNWYFSLHDRRFMSQAGWTRYFARSCLALRARVALRAKYRVRPAWLIKRLSCRLLVFWHLRLAPSTCISFYLKTNNFFLRFGIPSTRVSGENGHRKRIFSKTLSRVEIFELTPAFGLLVDGRQRKFSNTIIWYIIVTSSMTHA